MFLLGIIVLAMIWGWLRGGKLAGLGRQELRCFWLAPLAFLLQWALNRTVAGGSELTWCWSYSLHLFSYLLMFFFIWVNRSLPGIKLMFLGVFCNFLVIALNGGAMPVKPEGLPPSLVQALADQSVATHQLWQPGTKLPFLGDIILIPYPSPRRFSIGDFFMVAGLFIFITRAMTGTGPGEKGLRQVK